MSYINRLLEIQEPLKGRSVFLFGPRQSGKSTYLREQMAEKPAATFNLLDRATFLELSQDPTRIRQRAIAQKWNGQVIVIDEIQKLPDLLDEVHLMIEELRIRFVLTGSSARKLKQTGVNLLGGRARTRHLHPFVSAELGDAFDLERAMQRGLLPSHYFSDLPDEDLRSYIGLYLTEEIAAEGISRNIPAFSRFLEVAATCNTGMLNFTSVGSDAQVSRQTVQNYFQVLNDTLIGFFLPPFEKSKKRKAIGTPKFYFFDMGVVRILRGLDQIQRSSNDFGSFFEHFIFLELRAFISYKHQAMELSYWRSTSGFEVDFILGNTVAIEVKASSNIGDKHLRGLRALAEENLTSQLILLSFETAKRSVDNILIYPWKEFLSDLWAGRII